MFVVKETPQLLKAKQKAYEERPDVRKVEGTSGNTGSKARRELTTPSSRSASATV
jgi:hypothetical protein